MIGRFLARHQPVWLERIRLGGPLQAGPTGELAMFMDGRWRRESVFVELIAKIDEAGTHGGADYMMLGGYAGRLAQWQRFDHRWKKGLRKTGLTYFHVAEHLGHPFGERAVWIADRSLMFGFVVRLDKADYQRFYRQGGGWGGKAQPDSMYGLCFRFCLSCVLDLALQELNHEDLTISFVVEDGHPNCGAAPEIVSQLKKKRIAGVSEYLGAAVIGEKTKVPGLQAADCLISSAWKIEQPERLALRPVLGPKMRPSLKEWDGGTGGQFKCPILRCHLDEEHLATFKEGYIEHVAHRVAHGEERARQIAARKAASAADPTSEGS
jgi:hypothetical protein